jgi:hypothetical protein
VRPGHAKQSGAIKKYNGAEMRVIDALQNHAEGM